MKLKMLFCRLCLIVLIVPLLFACDKEDTVQENLDFKVIGITEGSATCLVSGIKENKETSWEYGICWNTDTLPIILNNSKIGQFSEGKYMCGLDHLKPGTTYHVRTFAQKNDEVVYGLDVPFKTISLSLYPGELLGATINTVDLDFQLSIGQGIVSIKEFGFCWSREPSPILSDSCVHFMPWMSGDGCNNFRYGLTMTGLSPNETYHVRAYATNPTDTFYGPEILVKTLPVSGTVTDIDGNTYPFKAIGNAVWMLENLRVTKYRDGTPIPRVASSLQWSGLKTGAYTLYDNNDENASVYGCLYNYYAVADSKGLAPQGWHVATFNEWESLVNYNGGMKAAGAKLKEAGTEHWTSPNANATNSSDFTALPGGCFTFSMSSESSFYYSGLGTNAYWWTSSWYGYGSSWGVLMFYEDSWAMAMNLGHTNGMSVRCVKD